MLNRLSHCPNIPPVFNRDSTMPKNSLVNTAPAPATHGCDGCETITSYVCFSVRRQKRASSMERLRRSSFRPDWSPSNVETASTTASSSSTTRMDCRFVCSRARTVAPPPHPTTKLERGSSCSRTGINPSKVSATGPTQGCSRSRTDSFKPLF